MAKQHVKRWSISLTIREIKIKTRDHLKHIRMFTIKIKKERNIRKEKVLAKMWKNWICALVHCWWKRKRYSHCGKQYGGLLKNLKTKLPHDPAIQLLTIYLKILIAESQGDICTFAFSAATRCPSTDGGTKRAVYLQWNATQVLEKEATLLHATTQTNLEEITLSEISLSQKDNVWIHL